MPSSPQNPHRDVGRHAPTHWPAKERGNSGIIVFVTVCTLGRKRVLHTADTVQCILTAWQEADAWSVGRYVIMPDHLHLFCSPRDESVSLANWIRFWKSRSSQRWPAPEQQPIWQRDGWDVQLRRGESYASKWEYVRNNPVRHGLVEKVEDWPWAGEIEELIWHEP